MAKQRDSREVYNSEVVLLFVNVIKCWLRLNTYFTVVVGVACVV